MDNFLQRYDLYFKLQKYSGFYILNYKTIPFFMNNLVSIIMPAL